MGGGFDGAMGLDITAFPSATPAAALAGTAPERAAAAAVTGAAVCVTRTCLSSFTFAIVAGGSSAKMVSFPWSGRSRCGFVTTYVR